MHPIQHCTVMHAGTPANLKTQLKEITQPHQFGLHLGLDPNVLQLIERNHPGDVARQRSEVIVYWSRNYECTWEKVADTLRRMGGHGNLERKLRQFHTQGMHLQLYAIAILDAASVLIIKVWFIRSHVALCHAMICT